MRDCSSGEVRDRLPELMHNRLSGETLVVVRAHVADCADCRAELALLEQLRSAVAPPRLDSARIVASLPRYRAVPAWRRALHSAQLRAAAAVVLLVGGYAVVKRSGDAPAGSAPAAQAQAAGTNELAIGDSFTDLTDSDLAAMVEEIGKLEAVTPEPTDEMLLPLSGGGA
jgi:hypothetical protein